ncbi:MAG: hypothetical protein AB2689_25350 [Candidatus Thiodiazotropha taylori]
MSNKPHKKNILLTQTKEETIRPVERHLSYFREIVKGIENLRRLEKKQIWREGTVDGEREMLQKKLRTSVFFWEGPLRLLNNKKILKEVKLLEDTLGLVDYQRALLKSSSDIRIKSEQKQTRRLQNRLRKKLQKSEYELSQCIERWKKQKFERWIKKRIDKLNLGDYWSERSIFEKAIKNDLERISAKKIPKLLKHLTSEAWTEHHIESITHELRRTIRWLPINLASLQIAEFSGGEEDNRKLEELISKNESVYKYAKLKKGERELAPFLQIPFEPYIKNTEIIARLGTIKDKRQVAQGLIIEIGKQLKLSSTDQIEEYIKEAGIEVPRMEQVLEETAKLLSEIIENSYIDQLAGALS